MQAAEELETVLCPSLIKIPSTPTTLILLKSTQRINDTYPRLQQNNPPPHRRFRSNQPSSLRKPWPSISKLSSKQPNSCISTKSKTKPVPSATTTISKTNPESSRASFLAATSSAQNVSYSGRPRKMVLQQSDAPGAPNHSSILLAQSNS